MIECSMPGETLDLFFQRMEERRGQTRLAYTGAIEITPFCNLKCVHCYVTQNHWEGNILTCTEVCRILDEMVAEGCLWLMLTGGEPLLRSDFLDIYTHAKKKGMFITIFTNATLVTPEIARHFHDWPPSLMDISIYGATKATYESITGVAGSFERCLRGIELLLEQGIKINLKTMAMTVNKHELTAMKKLAEGFGVRFRFDPILNPGLGGSRHPCDLRLPAEEIVRIDTEDPERREAWIKSFKHLLTLPPPSDRVFSCGAGNGQFHIDAYGRLQMCTIAREPSYDLRQGSFHNGWHSFIASVRAQKISQPSPCQTCRLRPYCLVCPGWTQLEYGTSDVQPVEYLCRIARLRAEAFGPERKMAGNTGAANNNALSRPLGEDIPPEEPSVDFRKGGGRHEDLP